MRKKRATRAGSARSVRARLLDAEATLDAIRSGGVDALVVSGPKGAQTLSIGGAAHPYYTLLDAMNDGAALLDQRGTILFGNRRLAELAHRPLSSLRGSRFQRLVAPADRADLELFLDEGVGRKGAREFAIARGASLTPVWIALSAVPVGNGRPGKGATVLMAIVTDLTSRKRAESTRGQLLSRLITAEDEERRRIARELHDETGQSLTALLVGLRAIEDTAVTDVVRTAAKRLRQVASETVDNVGRLARGLHPSVLDDLGLAAAARRYVSDFVKSFGLTVDLRMQRIAADGVAPLAQTTLYRILQESLTNVARHAHARAVVVELKRSGLMLELMVSDDGVGFDAGAALHAATGLGLHGMQERVALLGGAVEIVSTPGRGSTVRARIPFGARPRRRSSGRRAVVA
jgi:signal transduction histidine kinase